MSPSPASIRLHDLNPDQADVREEVLAGLAETPKRIPPKYFYDARGSALFDAITELPEYYLTRTETALLADCIAEVRQCTGAGALLIEYGSGSSRKTGLVLDALDPVGYMPLDISREHLLDAARRIAQERPGLAVHPTCVDYSRPWDLPEVAGDAARLAFFPGSSLGNFEPDEARAFLAGVAGVVGPGGWLLIGVDRRKDRAVLEAAYDDAAGVTAAFNRNVLAHLNERLDGDFDPDAFAHLARYDEAAGRIEMHLVASRDMVVSLAGTRIRFAAGERVRTEHSYKYTPEAFMALARRAGFATDRWWTDPGEQFGIYLLRAGTAPRAVRV